MKPTVGRIVHYILKEEDVNQINRRRTNGNSISERIKEDKWPIGAQAHIGNKVEIGQIVAMIIVAVWSDTCINGQAILDGTDVFWVTSTIQGEGLGQWNWPKREE